MHSPRKLATFRGAVHSGTFSGELLCFFQVPVVVGSKLPASKTKSGIKTYFFEKPAMIFFVFKL